MAEIIIHIGVHAVFPGLLQRISELDDLNRKESGAVVVGARAFRRDLREAIYNGHQDRTLFDAAMSSRTMKGCNAAENDDKVFVISQHNMLSGDADVGVGRTLYPEGRQRLENLTELFFGNVVHLRFAMADPLFWVLALSNRNIAKLDAKDLFRSISRFDYLELCTRLFDDLPVDSIAIWDASGTPLSPTALRHFFFDPWPKTFGASEDVIATALEGEVMPSRQLALDMMEAEAAFHTYEESLEKIEKHFHTSVQPLY